jgi:hypothetical protein
MRDREGNSIAVPPFVLHPDRTSFLQALPASSSPNNRRMRAILQQMEQMVDIYIPFTFINSRYGMHSSIYA